MINMERIEIFKLSDGTLCVEIYNNMNDQNSTKRLKGDEATDFICGLKNEKIFDIIPNDQTNEIVLVYKNKIIRLNEYEDIMYKKGMRVLRDNIKKFYEHKALKKRKPKKVTRKNKHTGAVISATSIIAIIALIIVIISSQNQSTLNNQEKYYNIDQIKYMQIIGETIPAESENYLEEIAKQIAENPNIDQKEFVRDVEETSKDDVLIEYEDRSETQKAYNAKTNYWYLIEKYSKMYGLDPNLVLAIATQERGVHSSTMDEGGATGLMQVQNAVWENQYKTSYNFETGEYETIFITREGIQDLEQNIKIGCTIFQECLQVMDYNIPAAIQCYNMGQGTMYEILTAYSKDTGKSIDEILSDPNDLGWMSYRDSISYGDPSYVENVLSWIGDSANITVLKNNGEEVSLTISNNTDQKNPVIC